MEKSKGKDKLIITTRPTLFSEIIRKLPTHNRDVQRIELEKLEYDDAKKMFISELPFLKNKQIVHLTNTSKGVPNVILEFVRLIRQGKQWTDISTENSFAESVHQIFHEASNDIEKSLHIPPDKTHEFLRLLSIISPVTNTETDQEFICKILDLRKDKLEILVNKLSDLGLVSSKRTISIKPDPYSDILLIEAITYNNKFIEHVIDQQGSEKYLENILKNLAEADVASNDKNSFITNLLVGYVSSINDITTEVKKLKNIFQFGETIFYYKPEISLLLIRGFLKIYKDPAHRMHTESAQWSQTSYAEEIKLSARNIITNLFTYTLYAKDHIVELNEIVTKFIRVTNDFDILIGCYGYHEFDFDYYGYHPRQCCEKQLFFKQQICLLLENSVDSFEITYALKGADTLLELEFRMEQYYEQETMQFHYGTAQVAFCPHIIEIRTDVLKSFLKFHFNHKDEEKLNQTALQNFLPYFFYCSANGQKRHKHNFLEEWKIAFSFFNQLLDSNPTIAEKNVILSKIKIYESVGFLEQYKSEMQLLIKKASQTTSLLEELRMIVLNEDYFDSRKFLEKRTTQIIEKYVSFNKLQKDLIDIEKEFPDSYQNFNSVLNVISRHYPKQSKVFFKLIQKAFPESILKYLGLLSEVYTDNVFFYGVIKWLWNRNHKSEVAWLLTYGRKRDYLNYRETDLNYIEDTINNNSNNESLQYSIIDYAYINKGRTFLLLDKYIKLQAKKPEYILIHLLDKAHKYCDDFKLEIKDLVDKNLYKIKIDDYFTNRLYEFTEDNFGFDELKNLMQQLLSSHDSKNSESSQRIYQNSNHTLEQRTNRYISLIENYINRATATVEDKIILSLFRPGHILDENLKAALIPVISVYKEDVESLKHMAEVIRNFQPYSREQMIILGMISEELLKNDKSTDLIKVFGSGFYDNWSGSKTKVGRGVGYNEDIVKKELIENVFGFTLVQYNS
ncbi:MAG: hypothetical protein WKF85_13190 [Chitinophagaceae bacterium]